MADPADPADQALLERYRSMSPIHQPDASGTGPASLVPSMPQGDIPWGKEIGMGVNQLGIGMLGFPSAVARGGMGLAHAIAPSYVPEVPPIMYPEGPEGYANKLTLSGFEPSNAAERVYANTARGAGTGVFFGPGGMLISGVGSGIGQTMTEAGAPPWAGETVEALSGLYGGYRAFTGGRGGSWFSRAAPEAAPAGAASEAGAAPAPRLGDDLLNDAGETNVIPFPNPRAGGAAPAPAPVPTTAPVPAAAASREASQMDELVNLERQNLQMSRNAARREIAAPMVRNPLNPLNWMRTAALRAMSPGTALASSPVVSDATSAARRILGMPAWGAGVIAGGTAGVGQAQEQIPPGGMSYSYVPPAQQPNQLQQP